VNSFFRCKNCLAGTVGYLLPRQSHIIASDWICDLCHDTKSHSDVTDLLKCLEITITEWTANQPVHNWHEMSSKLEYDLHPNHFLAFGLKKAIINNSQKMSTSMMQVRPLYGLLLAGSPNDWAAIVNICELVLPTTYPAPSPFHAHGLARSNCKAHKFEWSKSAHS
jgi:hypothetical protein